MRPAAFLICIITLLQCVFALPVIPRSTAQNGTNIALPEGHDYVNTRRGVRTSTGGKPHPKPVAPKHESPIVHLEPNSLYIGTSQIGGKRGNFHWSVYLTDTAGKIVKMHWMTSKTSKETGYAEAVQVTNLDSVSTLTNQNTPTFGYFKINGYACNDLHAKMDTFMKCANNAFPANQPQQGYATVMDNRKHGISCRTWAMGFLKKLIEDKILSRPLTDVPAIEAKIKTVSITIEDDMANFRASHVEAI